MGSNVLLVGFLVADIVVPELNRIAEPGELIFVPKGIYLSIGGHPANIAIDLVKMGFNPKDIMLISAVGKDIFGDFIVNTLNEYGLDLMIERVEVPTNKNVILVVKGQDRRFHVEVGASLYIPVVKVLKILESCKPTILYISSGILGKIDDELERILRRARQLDVLTFIDVVKPYDKTWDFLIDALPYVNILHCNDRELIDITNEKELNRAIEKVVKSGVELLFVTLGEKGAMAINKSGILIQPAFKIEVVDPTGAGDAFCSGVILKLLEKYEDSIKILDISNIPIEEISEIMLFAQALGAQACRGPGTTTAINKEEVYNLLEKQGSEILKKQKVRGL